MERRGGNLNSDCQVKEVKYVKTTYCVILTVRYSRNSTTMKIEKKKDQWLPGFEEVTYASTACDQSVPKYIFSQGWALHY